MSEEKNKTEKPKESKKKWVKTTFSKDMAEAAKTEKGQKIRKTLEEARRREEEKKQLARVPRLNLIFAASGLILVIIGIVLLSTGIAKRKTTVEEQKVSLPALIFTEIQKEFDITDLREQEIISGINSSVQNDRLEYDSIENLIVTETTSSGKKFVNPEKFLTAIESEAPAELVRELQEFFLLGIYSREINNLFVLFKTPSYAKAALGMRNWEDEMFDDLFELFAINTSGENKYLFDQSFEDKIVNNKNSRAILDNEENIVLMYQFIDDNNIIITTSTDALREVTNRITVGKIKR